MITDLKPYAVMKDSGVPWLGEVPEHWEVQRFKYVLRESDVRSASGTEQLLRVSQFTGVTERKRAGGRDEPDSRAESLVGYKLVAPNNLVVNIMLAWNGSMGVSRYAGIASPAYCVYRFGTSAHPWFFHNLLRSPTYKARIKAVSTGVVESRLRLYTDDLYRLEALSPPLPEQVAIARFLDHTERRINRYIQAKRKLIALLNEQKQAIIHQAVTRGLAPDVPLRPSGVDWLGDIPAHWDSPIKLKFVSTLKGRLGWQGLKASEYTEEGPYVVSSAHFKNHRIIWNICPHVTQERYDMDVNIQLSESDILLMKDGAAMGKLAYVDHLPDAACLNSHLLVFRPGKTSNGKSTYYPKYLFYFMLTEPFQGFVKVNGTGATFLGISQEKIGNYKIALPSFNEQISIAQYLDAETLSFDQSIERVEKQIDLIREYHTRLIADVVTGKLDVRQAAAKLPEEPDDSKSISYDEVDVIDESEDESADDLEEAFEEGMYAD